MKNAWCELIELSDELEQLRRSDGVLPADKAEILVETADNRKDILLVEALLMITTLRKK